MTAEDSTPRAEEAEIEGAREGQARSHPERSPLTKEGMERPAFVLDFPEDPELDRLVLAFEAGNYALVRTEAERLAARTERGDVRDAALELRRRTEPDPLAKYLLVASFALLVVLSLWAYHVEGH